MISKKLNKKSYNKKKKERDRDREREQLIYKKINT